MTNLSNPHEGMDEMGDHLDLVNRRKRNEKPRIKLMRSAWSGRKRWSYEPRYAREVKRHRTGTEGRARSGRCGFHRPNHRRSASAPKGAHPHP